MMPRIDIVQFNSLFYRFLDHFEASYTNKILAEAIRLLGQLWPYLLLGILASTILKMYISKQRMADFFSRTNNHASILLAALIGTANPLGSYVIIPDFLCSR